MPGTIKVSVLGFMDLPSSPSKISVTVSLGKKQYQALDKGDFSFSLTSIRDILVIVAGDVEGNQISRADIQVKSIVEKGYLDDHFHLEGGGRVRMQLQFLLSQDERNRIKLMRESASRKKQEEYFNMNPKSPGGTAMVRSSSASSFYLNPELSDSVKCLLQVGELSGKDIRGLSSPSSTSISLESCEKDSGEEEKGRKFDLNQQTPDRDEDSSSTVPMLPDINVHPSESSYKQDEQRMDTDLLSKVPLPSISFEENKNLLEPSASVALSEMNASTSPNELPEINIQSSDDQVAQKIGTLLLGDEVPVQTVSLEENVNLSKPSESTEVIAIESSISPHEEEGRILEAEKPTPMKKPPSNVKKMISAFEGSQAQDMKPQTKVPLTKSHAIMVSKQKLLTEDQLTTPKKEKINTSSSERDTKFSVFEEPKYGNKHNVKKRDEEYNLLQSLERTKLLENTLKKSTGTAEKLKDQPKEVCSKDQPKKLYPRDLSREENSDDQPTEVYATDQSKEINMKEESERQELTETANMEAEAATVSERVADYQLGKGQLVNSVDNPVKRSTREIPFKNSAEITKQGVSKEEQYFSESSNGWIFPGDAIKFCITAGGKALADLVGGKGGSSSINQGDKKISMEEHRGGGPGIGVIKGTKARPQNSKSISKGAETSEGPLRQALKIAIMVGFGTLILLTRQGKKRNN